ncbi:MAG: type II toxin-antitoxin system HicB family antitoxin [Oscillospiraceae bacterium]|jgi:predicted RNase H-like HicB family nuclease
MKNAYPIILTQGQKYVVVSIPDFDINTQGEDFADAMEMARDAIGLMGIDMQDDGKELPTPTPISELTVENSVVTLVDIDFDVYRRKNELRAVKKNCTIPSWLNYEAEKANINFSQVLQNALMEQLKISR